jgi:hypothetical protein
MIQLQTNFPAEYDPKEPNVIVQAQFHPGEKQIMQDHDGSGYPGSPPQIELLTVVNMQTGEQTDCDDLPGWLQDDFRAQVEDHLKEGH